jgi:hypothetical protein
MGLRVAQLKSTLTIANFRSISDVHLTETRHTFYNIAYITRQSQVWRDVAGNADSSHQFLGAGPSLFWEGSAPLWGDFREGGQLSLDFGVTGSVLFGKQKSVSSAQIQGNQFCYGPAKCADLATSYSTSPRSKSEKSVTVPNLSGRLGVSYRIDDMKVSVGYRSDFFFGALDTGIASQSALTRGFDGLFASVSIGLGGD